MKKYILAKNFGKGFITHQDQEEDGLKFSCVGNVVVLQGSLSKIRKWVSRIKGTELGEKDAITKIRNYRIQGIKNTIADYQNEILRLQKQLKEL